MNVGEFHLIETLEVFDSERRHFSSWRVQFGAPPFPDCPAPHRKVARTVWRPSISGLPSAAPKGARKSMGCAEAYLCTPHKKPRRLTQQGRKRTLSGRKLSSAIDIMSLCPSRNTGCGETSSKHTLSGRKTGLTKLFHQDIK